MAQLKGILGGSKIALILSDGFDLDTFRSLKSALEGAGATLLILGFEQSFRDSNGEMKIEANEIVSDVTPDDFDLLLLADEPTSIWAKSRPEACALVAGALKNSRKAVAAIGSGVELVICSDALKGRKVAAPPEIKSDVEMAGGMYKDRSIVIDDNLITASSAKYAPKVREELVKLLQGLPPMAA